MAENESVVYSMTDVHIVMDEGYAVRQTFPAITSLHCYNDFDGSNSFHMAMEDLSFPGSGEVPFLYFIFPKCS